MDEQEFLNWEEYTRVSEQLAKEIKEKFDSIICVSTGGLVLGKILSDILNLPLGIIAAKSYLKGQKEKNDLHIGEVAFIGEPEGRVLLVDDLVDSGETLKEVKKHLLEKKKQISEIKTAVLYCKGWRKFNPDYFLDEKDKWIVFPYEKNEFTNLKK